MGSFGISEDNITGREKQKTQTMHLTAIASKEVAQRLMSTTSKRAALLRVRTGPECPVGNLRELT